MVKRRIMFKFHSHGVIGVVFASQILKSGGKGGSKGNPYSKHSLEDSFL